MRPIPFACPYMKKKEITQISKAVKSGWLTTGKLTKQFENEFQKWANTKYALAVNSATAGLHLALEAAGIKTGDKVITTPYTFTSTAEVIRYLGADPIFVDILPDRPLIDPIQIEKFAHEAKAVIPVHLSGESCDMKTIIKICSQYNLFCLEDAAHAFPATVKNKKIGTQGDAGVYSFYATKTLATGEGGMVVTSNTALAKRIKTMRLHGIDRDVWDRFNTIGTAWEYDIVAPGFKYNMPDTSAALGLVQLNRAKELNEKRYQIAEKYYNEFSKLKELTLPKLQKNHSWHLFMLQISPEKTVEATIKKRNLWIKKLNEAKIGTSVHYKPLHLMSYYKDKYNLKPNQFPNALNRYSRTFSIPIYPGLTSSQIKYIIKVIQKLAKSNE